MRPKLTLFYDTAANLIRFSQLFSSLSSSSVIRQTTGPQHLPKRFFHLMRSRASSFKSEYPLLSPRSSSSFLRLLPRLLVTSIRPFIFPSITSFRRQFLYKIYVTKFLDGFLSPPYLRTMMQQMYVSRYSYMCGTQPVVFYYGLAEVTVTENIFKTHHEIHCQ
jgi:hypothetical protein